MSEPAGHIEGRCPHCGASWRVKAEFAGRRLRCRKCGGVFPADPSSDSAGAADATGASGTPSNAAAGGDTIPGYQIEAELGRGGMGVVYRARDLATKRRVALKVMLEARYADERQIRRFEREVEIAASLEHPNIARIYASGLHEGHHWFAMEYVKGRPLDAYIADQKLGVRAILELFVPICDAVNHAHQRGVLHRDLKPGNIMVDGNGQPRVLDFGLAKLTERPTGPDDAISMAGDIVGTPSFMSPEQTRGDPTRIDIRTDVYSLGVILYRLLTGESPYGTEDSLAELLRAISDVQPQGPHRVRKGIPGEVGAIVLKSLEKSPTRRYQSAGQLGADIAAFLSGEPVSARQGSGWYVLSKTAGRYRNPTAVVLGVVVLSAGLGLVMGVKTATTRTEINTVTREVEVIREAPPDDSLQAELQAAQAMRDRLRIQLEQQQRETAEAQNELAAPRGGLVDDFDPTVPEPNPANPVNYIDWFNTPLGDDNAVYDYFLAFECVKDFKENEGLRTALNDVLDTGRWNDNQELADWLNSNRKAAAMFRRAASREQCFFPLRTRDTDDPKSDRLRGCVISVVLPALSKYRLMTRVLVAEGWKAWHDGDEEPLIGNALAILRASHHLENQPHLIEHLIAVSCAQRAYDAVASGLARTDDPDVLAARLQPQLLEADPAPADFTRFARLERSTWYDVSQRIFLPGGQRGTWAIDREIGELFTQATVDPSQPQDKRFTAQDAEELAAIGFDRTVREFDAYHDFAEQWCRTPHHLATDRLEELERRVTESQNPLVRLIIPSLSRARELHERGVATRRATHLIVHLFVHRRRTGQFPATLDELNAPDLDELRIDPFSGQDFFYERQGRDFRLYSVADNLQDDGGRGDQGQSGSRTWKDGDYVFWPRQR